MLNYVIVVNDGGEMKTISATEMEEVVRQTAADLSPQPYAERMEALINFILDQRAIAAGEYDPADNDTPMVFTMGGGE